MRLFAVVLVAPGGECTPDVVQGAEPVCVQAFVTQPTMFPMDWRQEGKQSGSYFLDKRVWPDSSNGKALRWRVHILSFFGRY
jgi:hypothetical protein